jgi:endonuclease G
MPPRRRSSAPSSANPIDGVLRILAGLLGRRGGRVTGGIVALLTVLTGGWYLFQPLERKQEINQLVSNYSQQHKRIQVTEILWDIWTLYFKRPFVPTKVRPGDEAILFAGEPVRASFPHPIRTLYNTAYTVGYCDALDNPVWVGYRVFDLKTKPVLAKRPESFFTDTRTTARVETGDFTGSGYDRGHMAPNYAIGTRFGPKAQEETFLLSNICPQRHRLNAGLWKELELKIADNYTGRYGQIRVVVGPIFGPLDRLQRLRSKVPVPLAFYMIVLQQHEGGVRAEAFIMDQDAPARGSLDPYLTSIDEIEKRTGLDFFPQMEKQSQAKLEAEKASAAW